MLLVDRIAALEQEIADLKNKILDLSKNTQQKYIQPITRVGGTANKALQMPVDIDAGFGAILGNGVIWNDSELGLPTLIAEPAIPTKGYNKHTHSRYSGGALIKQNLEIVEYDATDWALINNPHCQQFWQITPKIKKTLNSKDESVENIGTLDLIFNADTGKWGVATLEIDIKACQFVQRRTTDGTGGEKIGDIELDSKGQEMKGPLWNADQTKSSIIWDEDGRCFRLYSVYSPGTVSGE